MANAAVVGHRVAGFKAADQSVTFDSALGDVDDLTFAMAANQKYKVRAHLLCTVAGAAAIQIGVAGPAAPANVHMFLMGLKDETSLTYYEGKILAAAGSHVFTNATVVVTIEGVWENGANAGTFSVQFCQGISGADAVTVKRGSFIEAELLP